MADEQEQTPITEPVSDDAPNVEEPDVATEQDDERDEQTAMALPPEMKRWQVRFGADKAHGHQFTAESEEAVRAEVCRIYGADYAETITELFEIV